MVLGSGMGVAAGTSRGVLIPLQAECAAFKRPASDPTSVGRRRTPHAAVVIVAQGTGGSRHVLTRELPVRGETRVMRIEAILRHGDRS